MPTRPNTTSSTTVLDNVAWHAITGANAHLAERVGLAGRYHHDVAPFCAIGDQSPQAWLDLATLIGPGRRALLFGPDVEVPSDWTIDMQFGAVQMVAGDVADPPDDLEFVDLGPQDVPEMLDLIGATQPGPFSKRTIKLGRYLGYRIDGRLVAMAGERMHPPGFTEVSAVCTSAECRGRGLGSALTLAMTKHIRSRGEEAFLHASETNTNAIRLYKALGFEMRREDIGVLILKPPEEA